MSGDLQALRADFDPKYIGKLPRLTCKACSNRKCDRHSPRRCDGTNRDDGTGCGAWISPAHIHIDFVGHAHVTDRLLSVDPAWGWEPLAFTAAGLPAIERQGNRLVLWIRLTAAGVTRLGVGTVEADASEPEKQLIGDAIRNAALRFGVGLKLWATSELESSEIEGAPAAPAPPAAARPEPAVQAPRRAPAHQRVKASRVKALLVLLDSVGVAEEDRRPLAERASGGRTNSLAGLYDDEADAIEAELKARVAS